MKGKTTSLLFRLLPVCAGCLTVIEILFINQYAGSGQAVYAIDASIASVRQENNLLEQRVASASSLITIAAKAKDIGFTEPLKSQYLTVTSSELPVAFYNPH